MRPLPEGVEPEPADRWVSPQARVPVTLVLYLDDARKHLPRGELRGRLGAHYFGDQRWLEIDGRRVPVELELTAALAHGLADSPVWDFELRGFFSGSFRLASEKTPDRLVMMSPRIPGRVPVVLVHGTASSPGRWADLVNEIYNDRELAARVEPWLFIYNTGNPIAYSAGLLRKALADVVAAVDPDGDDAALSHMVVIGHSQGGLLTRLQVTDAGMSLWDSIFDVSLEEFDIDGEAKEILRQSLVFAPAPSAARVVYVSTPHRGSYLASFRLANLLSSLLRLPANIVGIGVDVLTLNRDRLQVRRIDRVPTSIDNMRPGHPFMEWLRETPPVPWVPAHSIIPVKGGPPPEGQSDGVVRYESAHLEDVASEKVVYHASHSVQGHPEAIREMKRILRVHLEELPRVLQPTPEPDPEAGAAPVLVP